MQASYPVPGHLITLGVGNVRRLDSGESFELNDHERFAPISENRARCEELSREITLLAGHLNAANYRLLKLIAEFDTRNGWSNEGCQSCAHWLNFMCGIGMGAAREKVRVAHALESLPQISASMERGELSYSKVRELTRVADEHTEEILLMYAQHGTAEHVERIVRGYRRAKDAEELSREAVQRETRYLRYSYDDDGSLIIKAKLPAEAGALFLKALDAAIDELPLEDEENVPAGTSTVKSWDRPTKRATQRADALALMTESFIARGAEVLSGGDKHQVVIHIDADALRDGTSGRCEFEDGASMAAETARRLACDCSVVSIIENDKGEPLSVGRKTRSIPPALRRALNSRDQGCRFPGCCNKRYVDGHHIEHWANGGETKLSNLVTLCRFHHHLVHEDGVTIEILDDGALRFIKPDGRTFNSVAPSHTQPLHWNDIIERNDADGIQINHRTAITLYDGVRVDYGLAVGALCQRNERNLKPTSDLSKVIPS